MSLNSGAVLSDRYRLLRLIATGGMGQVWEAGDSVLDRRVAVKVLKPEYSSDPEFLERFRSEAKVTARISHPGIATVYDYGQIDDPASGSPLSYLVMELVVGEPLSDVLAREGSLPLRHTLDMLEQTGRALNAAHAIGLVHRDVKPGNILITPAGQVKLTDFGIAKSMGASTVTQTGMVVGTAQYISPEQAMGHETSPAGDVYSLGVVGYECLAGRRPFVAESPVSIAMMHVRENPAPLPNSVPEPVRRVLAEAMVKDPSRRYPDGGAFAEAIADVRAGREPRPPSAFIAAAGAATGAAGMGALTAGAAAATTVLPDDAVGGSGSGAPGGEYSGQQGPRTTRMYTQMQPGHTTARPQTAPTRRPPSPPVTSRPPQRRSGSGCAGWFLVVFLLVTIVVVAGVIALSNAGVFGQNGLFGRSPAVPVPTTSAPVTVTTTRPPPPASSPTLTPTPTPSPEPSATTSELPPPPDLSDMLDSITSEFSSLLPQPGQAQGRGQGQGQGQAQPQAQAQAQNQGASPQNLSGQGAPGQVEQGRGGERG